MIPKKGLDKAAPGPSYAQKRSVGNFLNNFSAYGIDFASHGFYGVYFLPSERAFC
jgi:hypothetical protein